MDKTVTIRFYEVERHTRRAPRLWDVLEGISNIDLPQRRREIGIDFYVRLERLEVEGPDVLKGEFTRVQTTNYPSEVHEDGTRPLDVDGPLGHGVAFRFDRTRNLLAAQYDRRVCSPGRMMSYLQAMNAEAKYRLKPIVNDDMWERFNEAPTRKVEITVASPTNLEDVEGDGRAAFEAARMLGAMYEAPVLKIEMSMGRRNGALSEHVKGLVRELFEMATADTADVRALKAVTDQGEGQENDEINLMEELLTVRDSLALPDNDPDRSYQVRSEFIQTAMLNV